MYSTSFNYILILFMPDCLMPFLKHSKKGQKLALVWNSPFEAVEFVKILMFS